MIFKQAFNDKVVIARWLVQYWQIFSSFLIFCCYFTCLETSEISCKISETRKIFPILHSAPYDNNYIFYIPFIFYHCQQNLFTLRVFITVNIFEDGGSFFVFFWSWVRITLIRSHSPCKRHWNKIKVLRTAAIVMKTCLNS